MDRRLLCTLLGLMISLPLDAHAQESQTAAGRSRQQKIALLLQPGQLKHFEDDPEQMLTRLERAAIEAGEPAVPMLRRALFGRDRIRRNVAAEALAVIGGSQAVTALKKEYVAVKDLSIKSWLCFSMASTGSSADRQFLIQALQGPTIMPDGTPVWQPMESAAISLGLLRAKEAVPTLEALKSREPGTIPGGAASNSLQWIQSVPPQTPQAANASERDQILFTMFRSGIPRTDDSPIFQESNTGRIWRFQNASWKFLPPTKLRLPKQTPSITFDVYETVNRRHAIVSVGMTFGPLDGEGHDYFLKRRRAGGG